MHHLIARPLARPLLPAGIAVALALIAAGTRWTVAFPRYNDGCHDCHGAFTDGTSPKGTVFPMDSKHEMHRGAAYMNTDCDLCHLVGDNHNPFTNMSNGTLDTPGYGCVGCHGRVYPEPWGPRGVGLREHHNLHGVDFCVLCHPDNPAPYDESVPPPYYGSPDTEAGDPCNAAPGYAENWSVNDTEGLDNDGDDLYDTADPDCAAAPCPWDCADGDGVVGILDFLALLAQWGQPGGSCDLGLGDPGVDILEFLDLLANWGDCPA